MWGQRPHLVVVPEPAGRYDVRAAAVVEDAELLEDGAHLDLQPRVDGGLGGGGAALAELGLDQLVAHLAVQVVDVPDGAAAGDAGDRDQHMAISTEINVQFGHSGRGEYLMLPSFGSGELSRYSERHGLTLAPRDLGRIRAAGEAVVVVVTTEPMVPTGFVHTGFEVVSSKTAWFSGGFYQLAGDAPMSLVEAAELQRIQPWRLLTVGLLTLKLVEAALPPLAPWEYSTTPGTGKITVSPGTGHFSVSSGTGHFSVHGTGSTRWL